MRKEREREGGGVKYEAELVGRYGGMATRGWPEGRRVAFIYL
jgi:hypothetical protein